MWPSAGARGDVSLEVGEQEDQHKLTVRLDDIAGLVAAWEWVFDFDWAYSNDKKSW